MLKVISLLKRADDVSKEDFVKWAVHEHPEFARKLPGLSKYTVSVTEAEDAAFDSVNEMWFDDEDARVAAFGSESGKAAAADASAHASQRVHLLTTEHEPL
jgi:uncharacterized protein (TIGR02118 family)